LTLDHNMMSRNSQEWNPTRICKFKNDHYLLPTTPR